jgi:transposase InsO family protein
VFGVALQGPRALLIPRISLGDLQAARWRPKRMLSDNRNEFRGPAFREVLELGARHSRIHAGRPQTNGHVEALHKTILDEWWRPAFARYLYPAPSAVTPAEGGGRLHRDLPIGLRG